MGSPYGAQNKFQHRDYKQVAPMGQRFSYSNSRYAYGGAAGGFDVSRKTRLAIIMSTKKTNYYLSILLLRP